MSSISVVKIDWQKTRKKHLAATNRFLKGNFPDRDLLTESGFQNLAHSHCLYLALRDDKVAGIGVLVLYSTHKGRAGFAHIDTVEGASAAQIKQALKDTIVGTAEGTFREFVDFVEEPTRKIASGNDKPARDIPLAVTRKYV